MGSLVWSPVANFPGGGRYGPTEFVINGKAYVGFGIITGIIYKNDIWQYDPDLNIWTQKANLPTAGKFSPRSFVIDGKGYVMTGWTPSPTSDLWQFDPIINQWTQKTSFPGGARYTGVAIAVSGKGFFGTGYNPLYNDWWQYDPIANSWAQKADVPGPNRQSAVTFALNNIAYVGLGSGIASGGGDYSDFYSYNPATNIWTTLPNFPGAARYGCEEFISCGKGYVGMGRNSSGAIFNDFYSFNPQSNAWNIAGTFPGLGREAGTGFSINSVGYVGLGKNGSYKDDVWKLDCPEDSFAVTNGLCNSTISFHAIANLADSYIWNFGDGTSTTGSNVSHTFSNSGTYNVCLISKADCLQDTFCAPVTVTGTSLNVQHSLSYDTCSATIEFLNSTTGALSFYWDFGDSTYSNLANPIHQYIGHGSYQVSMISSNQCDSIYTSIQIEIPELIPSVPLFSYNIDSCSRIVTFNNESIGAESSFWNFMDGSISEEVSPSHSYINYGTYEVLLITGNEFGCKDSIVKPVTISQGVLGEPFVPNCFTPNGDNLNETFNIVNENSCLNYEMQIYNRWGQLIFQTNSLDKSWNGKYNDVECPDGVYYYILKYNKKMTSGSITILR